MRILTLWLMTGTFLMADGVRPSLHPIPREDMPWIGMHEEDRKRAKAKDYDFVFLGDSLIAQWEDQGAASWKPWMGRALNLGIPGDRTENVLWRLKHSVLKDASPRIVVIQIGTNNLKGGPVKRPVDEVVAGVQRVVAVVREQLPKARIVLMGLFPRQPKYDWIDARVREVNAALAKTDGVVFLDMGARLRADNGEPSTDLFHQDRLHLNAQGYSVWAAALSQYLE